MWKIAAILMMLVVLVAACGTSPSVYPQSSLQFNPQQLPRGRPGISLQACRPRLKSRSPASPSLRPV